MIPVVDLFAGPGGLNEGFSAFRARGQQVFRVALSIEKDERAHETLRLRSFFRQFAQGVPEAYYEFLRGDIKLGELYERYPDEASRAFEEAWRAELGNPSEYPVSQIDERIEEAIGGCEDWVLIGGPPCQAYSLVGRARMSRDRVKFEKDERHFLYKEYLRILAKHRPPVFVMENVKGILSSKVEGSLIIDRIIADLRKPCEAVDGATARSTKSSTYELFPFADYGAGEFLFSELRTDASGYVIRCEQHGIPQARHRFIVMGIRNDALARPKPLRICRKEVPMWQAIRDLPRLRSRLSKREDSAEQWASTVKKVLDVTLQSENGVSPEEWKILRQMARKLDPSLGTGGEYVKSQVKPKWMRHWFFDSRIGGVCNHSSRAHIEPDLWRYFFAACFAEANEKSPTLTDFPVALLPDHGNAQGFEEDDEIVFADRFRVQVKNRPSTTVTSHVAKDGHYFIHPDPRQCRSLTVREVARLQTFPDNYFFMGPRTAQYQQVGNAVPPLLARKLAAIVYRLLR